MKFIDLIEIPSSKLDGIYIKRKLQFYDFKDRPAKYGGRFKKTAFLLQVNDC